jgi:hypothetical protein
MEHFAQNKEKYFIHILHQSSSVAPKLIYILEIG